MTKYLRPAETAHSFLLDDHLVSELYGWLEGITASVHRGCFELQLPLTSLFLSKLVISM